ncbi:MAG: NIF family HAD-type phosphatase [Pseudomonadota bacterium]|nr:NIF family HAD-type phosphatase [Pseudomonadota bacterium]
MLYQQKGIIFDLDQTLVDTSAFEKLRQDRNWNAINERMDNLEVSPQILELLYNLKQLDWKIMVVSSANENYVKRILDKIGDKLFDDFIGNAGANAFQKSTKYNQILKKNNVKKAFAYAVGDSQIDIDAANKLGIGALGAAWSDIWPKLHNQYVPPPDNCDIVFHTPRELLNHLKPDRYMIFINAQDMDVLVNVNDPILFSSTGDNHLQKESGSRLMIFRSPYETKNRIQYHYAVVCLHCHTLFELKEIKSRCHEELRKELNYKLKLLRELKVDQPSVIWPLSLDEHLKEQHGHPFNILSSNWILGEKAWFIQETGSIAFYCPECS